MYIYHTACGRSACVWICTPNVVGPCLFVLPYALVDPRVRRPYAFNVIDEEGPVGFEPDRLAKHKAELVRLALRECYELLENDERGEAQHSRSSKYMLIPLDGG